MVSPSVCALEYQGLPLDYRTKDGEGVLGSPIPISVTAIPLSMLASAHRPAVWCPWEVQWGEPLHTEEDGLILHHPGLPALSCQVRHSGWCSVRGLALSDCFSDQHGSRPPTGMLVFFIPKDST